MAKKDKQTISPVVLFGGVVVLELLAAISALVIITGNRSWYNSLVVPFFAPAPWLVISVWFFLYPLMAGAIYLAYKNKGNRNLDITFILFGVAVVLPILRAIFFWELQDLVTSTAIEILLWLIVIGLTLRFWRASKKAGALMTPVLLWITFRVIVFLSIMALNGIMFSI